MAAKDLADELIVLSPLGPGDADAWLAGRDAAWKLWRLLLLEEDGAWQTIQGRNDTPMS
jgi:hypothetical protein